MLNDKTIAEFKEYLTSGKWEEDFCYRTPDGQAEMLDFIEAIFDLCETADKVISKRLYRQMGEAFHT